MNTEQSQIEAAIAALQGQREVLGAAVVDAMLAGLRARLATLATLAKPAAAAVPAAEAVQSLRQVTILFLDVVGSTTFSQHLDPETISAVMDGALARATAVVHLHRGRVLQYAGDNILAAFGADAASEDDAERAVHCGLALLELGRRLGAEVQATHGHAGFNVRVGLHTGRVLLGGALDADGAIRGSAVNIAARMEQSAPAGGLRISHATYTQVRGLFEVKAQEPLFVKGVDAPVQSYLVQAAKPRNFRIVTRGIEGVATRMIGRDTELQTLQAAFKRVFQQRTLAAVTVVADAGVGKSRLLYEFEAWSEAEPEAFLLFRGRARPQTGTQAFGLLRDILAWRFQINDDDSVEAARKKMEDAVVPLFVADGGPDLAEAHAHLLGHLIGIEWKASRHISGILADPKQIKNRALHTAAQLLRRVSASAGVPLIMQIEDLHWADNESLDFLRDLFQTNHDMPLLLLAFTRPTLFERRSDWLDKPGVHQRIDLAPLGPDTSRMLAQELLQKLPEVPAALRELLTGSAEGNPFYMEELVKMLIDQGAITVGETWSISAERLLMTQVPPTLTGVLQARLDGLPAPVKHALQQASVVGAVFWDQALAAIDVQASEQLPALVQRELAVPNADTDADAALVGLREFAFGHHLLHQVTYDTLLKRAKRSGHAKVAQWLAGLLAQGSARAGDFLGLAAEHFEQAGDDANAAEFHARAAEQASQRFAHERVLAHVAQALARIGPLPAASNDPTSAQATQQAKDQAELRWRLLIVREQTLDLQARRDEQGADLDTLAQLADGLDDDQRRAEVAWRRSLRANRMADTATMESAARHGLACATRAGDKRLQLHTQRLLARALMQRREYEAGRALALPALAEAQLFKLRDVEGRLLDDLAQMALSRGDLAGCVKLALQCLSVHRETGDRVNQAISLSNLGLGSLMLGDLVQAQLLLDEALPMLREQGNRFAELVALCHLSTLALWLGDASHALALALSAQDMAAAAKAPDKIVLAGLKRGEAELALGHHVQAHQAFTQTLARAIEIDVQAQHDASAGLARVALAQGDLVAAVAALQPVLARKAAGGPLDGTVRVRLIEWTCHQVLARAGDADAADWLARAHQALIVDADAITDTRLRAGFLHHIPHHREIVAAWGASVLPGRVAT